MNVLQYGARTDASAHLVGVDSYQLRSMYDGHSTPPWPVRRCISHSR